MRDHGECLEKWHRKVLTAPTTWRVQAGRALCDQNIVGGQGYDARTKSRDAFLAHSEFVPLLTELLLLLREGA